MLQRLEDLPPGIEGIKAIGEVSKEDYTRVLEPLLESAHRDGKKIRFIYELGPDLETFTAGAAWEDMRIGVQFLRAFEGCAIVSDLAWIRETTRLVGFAMPCPIRVFGLQERAQAIAWLEALPELSTVSVRVLAGDEVIVVEPKQALRTADFDTLVAAVDESIASHGELRGLVIHAREFPGWENIASMMRHVRFVRDHRHKIRRIAFATDSKLASIAVGFAEVFVAAELKQFTYQALDQAIAWAHGSTDTAARETHASP
jgi:hypothetical protein